MGWCGSFGLEAFHRPRKVGTEACAKATNVAPSHVWEVFVMVYRVPIISMWLLQIESHLSRNVLSSNKNTWFSLTCFERGGHPARHKGRPTLVHRKNRKQVSSNVKNISPFLLESTPAHNLANERWSKLVLHEKVKPRSTWRWWNVRLKLCERTWLLPS